MSRHLQRQLDRVKEKILHVGVLVEEAIAKAITALATRDAKLAQEVIEADDAIDHNEIEVEEEVINTLAIHQPVAADLRFIVAVLKINNDLERMGDLATNIAKRVLFFARCEPFDLPADLQPMATKAQLMVKQGLDALVNADADLARRVLAADDEVDALRNHVRDDIKAQIDRHPDRTDALLRLLSVARHLERMADMSTNVAEEVIYMVEGEIVRHRRDR
jgi:phosphate transport system protein